MIEFIRSENFQSSFYFILFVVMVFNFSLIRRSEVLGKMKTIPTLVLIAACLMTFFGFLALPQLTDEASHYALVPMVVCGGALCEAIMAMMERERLDNKSKRRSIHHAKD